MIDKIDVDIVLGIVIAVGLIGVALIVPFISYFVERKNRNEVKKYGEIRNKRKNDYQRGAERIKLADEVERKEQEAIKNARMASRRSSKQ